MRAHLQASPTLGLGQLEYFNIESRASHFYVFGQGNSNKRPNAMRITRFATELEFQFRMTRK